MDAKEKWWAEEVEKRREARRNDEGLHRRVKVKAEILDVLAKHKCTVTEVRLILSDMVSIIEDSATVPEKDYLQVLSERLF